MGKIAGEVIPLRTKVVVNNVQDDHHPPCVRSIDKCLHVLGTTVSRIGCVQQYIVVAPVAVTRKVGKRHKLDTGDAQRGKMIQPAESALKGAFLGESTYVQLVQH